MADPEIISSNIHENSELLKEINELDKGKIEVVLESFRGKSEVEAEGEYFVLETQLENDVASAKVHEHNVE